MSDTLGDLGGHPRSARAGLWTRRAVVTLLAALAVAAAAGAFGQEAVVTRVSAPAAVVELSAPERIRGGLLFQTRIDVEARQPIDFPRIVLDRGYVDGMQVNSIEPQPVSESSRDGALVLSYDEIATGERLRIWMHFQVEPTIAGTRPLGFEVDDGTLRLARLDRELRVLP
jgi:hypothetical protein